MLEAVQVRSEFSKIEAVFNLQHVHEGPGL